MRRWSSGSARGCTCPTSCTTSSKIRSTRHRRCSSAWSPRAIWGGSPARASTTTRASEGQRGTAVATAKAIDMHVHLPMDEWLDNAIGPLLPATEAYFRAKVPRRSIEEVAEEYASRDILGVVLDWDDRTVTGRGWLGNEWLASLSERFPGVLMGFGSVDPHSHTAVDEMERCRGLGLMGL